MQQQPEIDGDDFSQRVITALTRLADLSLRTSTLRFSPSGTWKYFASVLLSRLVTICEAQQGALVVVRPADDQSATRSPQAWVALSQVVLLASTSLSEENAHTVLALYPPAAPEWFTMDHNDLPPFLIWKRPLSPHLSLPGGVASQLGSHTHALLLFLWPAASQHAQQGGFIARAHARKLLPLLADLVDTVLLHLLTAMGEREPLEKAVLPTELLATVGHEFRGPLTTIQGYATTLQQHKNHLSLEERQEFLQAIGAASTHLGKLVDRFLELAQFEAQTALFSPALVDLAALAHEAMTAVKKNRSHVLLQTSPPTQTFPGQQTGGDELTVVGDRRELRTMLDLFLENAVAYSPHESLVEVSIHASNAADLPTVVGTNAHPENHVAVVLPAAFQEHEPLVEIEVRDSGRGIPPEQLPQIFQRFYRGDTRLTREVNGLGLGLTLCWFIVMRHRGMLWVESALGVGSTFHIVLPHGRAIPISERV